MPNLAQTAKRNAQERRQSTRLQHEGRDAGLMVSDAKEVSRQLTLLIETRDDFTLGGREQQVRKNQREIESKLLLQSITNIQGKLEEK